MRSKSNRTTQRRTVLIRPMTFGLGQRTTGFATIGQPTLTGKLIA